MLNNKEIQFLELLLEDEDLKELDKLKEFIEANKRKDDEKCM